MGDRHLTPVSVRTVFERFPASVRGAVVIRGEDPEPHHVVLASTEVVPVPAPGRAVRELELGPATVDVAPRAEVMIPFEVSFAGLAPGWYAVVAEVVVDGGLRVRGPEGAHPRFVVGWPRGSSRRGTVDLDLPIRVPGSAGAVVERVEFRADSAVVRWRHDPSGDAAFREFGELRVTAGGRRVPTIDDRYDPGSGARTTVTYPVMKDDDRLGFELDRRYRRDGPIQRGRWSATARL